MSWKFIQDEGGATAMEYGLMVALISVVMMSALFVLGPGIQTNFNTVKSGFTAAAP